MAKQNSPIVAVRWKPGKGGLIADIAARDMPNGGLYTTTPETGALNVRAVGHGTNISPDYEQILGNSLLATLDPVTAQTKQFRIYLDTTSKTVNSQVFFRLALPDGSMGGTVTVAYLAASNIATCLAATKTSIDLLAVFSPTSTTTTTGANTGYVTFEFASPLYIDFRIEDFTISGDITASYDIQREAIDEGMTGEWNMIGSSSETGNAFLMFTTKKGDTGTLTINNAQDDGSGLIQITTAEANTLVSNQIVTISGVGGTDEANGIWSITVIDSTNFTLQKSAFVNPYTSGGLIQYNVTGYGEIGVVYRVNSTTISYVRLLRSREFNFSTFYQIDARSKLDNIGRYGVYFTDNNNPYRVFFYRGDFIQDGALKSVDAQNIYEYGSISAALMLMPVSGGIKIEFETQLQPGGSVRSGNKRYSVRFLTASFAPTAWSELTNPVMVYSYNNQSGVFAQGDEENIVTPKINVLKITNPYGNSYSYCEIAVIEYVGIAIQGSIIGRYTLNGNEEQFINHTGNELDSTDLDVGSLVQIQRVIDTGRNIEMLDNRLIISNLKPTSFPDFTPFAETFRYSLEVEDLEPVGIRTTTPDADMQIGEYQVVENFYSKLSHMRYETYRYFIRLRMRDTGFWTPAFYLGYDIKIDLPTVLPTERDAGTFASFDLTDTYVGAAPQSLPPFATKTKSIYIDFHDFDLDFQIDGRAVREWADKIEFVRAKVVPTVLYNAMAVMGVHGAVGPGGGSGAGYWLTYDFASTGCIGPFPLVSGTNWFSMGILPAIGGDNPAYSTYPGGRVRKAQFHISPDLFLSGTAVTFQTGDQIINFGNPKAQADGIYNMLKTFREFYKEYNGATGHTDNTTVEILDIDDAKAMAHGTPFLKVGGQHYSTNLGWGASFTPSERYSFWDTMAILTDTDANNVCPDLNTDYGFYDVLYYRPKSDQYGSPEDNVCESTGVVFDIGTATGVIASGTISVFGDVCTQRAYIKHRYPHSSATGFGGGLGFYTQNRVNAQMFRKPTPTSPDIFPEQNPGDWLTASEAIDPRLNYNQGYTYQNGVTSSSAFDENVIYQTDWSNVIMYSEPQADGSNVDSLRIFYPNNIKFLDKSDGAIMACLNVNNELISIQYRNTLRLYFNSTSILTTVEGSETVLGDGSVLGRKGTTMTRFGSQHKWSVFKGKSERGFDVVYFIDWLNKAACRLGYNGNDTLEEINLMKSFFANNLDFVFAEDKPASGLGICAIFNQRYREAAWTIRGYNKQIEEYAGDAAHLIGDIVQFGTSTGFEDVPNFYIALIDNTGVSPDTITDPPTWEQIAYTDNRCYNLYTLVFSEMKNQFQAFHTPKPFIYALFENGYLVPRPISNTGQIYLNDSGQRGVWFDDADTVLTGDSFIDAVINSPEGRKDFYNLSIESLEAVSEITCTTPSGVSVTPNSEAEQREGNEWVTPIVSDANDSFMYGDYAIFRFKMIYSVYNKINSFACRLRAYVARQTDS